MDQNSIQICSNKEMMIDKFS